MCLTPLLYRTLSYINVNIKRKYINCKVYDTELFITAFRRDSENTCLACYLDVKFYHLLAAHIPLDL